LSGVFTQVATPARSQANTTPPHLLSNSNQHTSQAATLLATPLPGT